MNQLLHAASLLALSAMTFCFGYKLGFGAGKKARVVKPLIHPVDFDAKPPGWIADPQRYKRNGKG